MHPIARTPSVITTYLAFKKSKANTCWLTAADRRPLHNFLFSSKKPGVYLEISWILFFGRTNPSCLACPLLHLLYRISYHSRHVKPITSSLIFLSFFFAIFVWSCRDPLLNLACPTANPNKAGDSTQDLRQCSEDREQRRR